MPNLQSNYLATHARWIKGMQLNMEPATIVSRIMEDAEGVGFGEVVVQGTADNQGVDAEVTVKPIGIAVLDVNQPTGKYEQYSTAAVMKQGVIVVTASVAVAVGDPIYYVPGTGVLTNVSSGNTQLPGEWATSTAGSGLAAVRLNMP